MFTRVLVANRGEIACRIIRTLRARGIESVLVHSARDRALDYVRSHPMSVELPDTDRTGGYLDIGAVVDIAQRTGCDALHPGYGFLSENPDLAHACVAAGIVFIGPSAAAMAALGDKARARTIAVSAGVPVVPGVEDDAAARALPLPILIKPVAGGGGKGMHVLSDMANFDDLVARARREAGAAFGDERLIFEKYLPRARHIEVQVVGLPNGDVVAVGDRECSLQRRHQKVIEEAPAPNLPADVRAAIHNAATAVVSAVGYVNAGTVEFVVSCDDPTEFYFLEVNTRLQVEHPVTEEVTGLDLVDIQLHIAYAAAKHESADAAVDLLRRCASQEPCGHAIEARVYAEDPASGFLPSAGPLLLARWPDDVRTDAGVRSGDVIGAGYDPMIAKVIARGSDRDSALATLTDALTHSAVLGVSNNVGFLTSLLRDPAVINADMDTRLIDREQDRLVSVQQVPWWLDSVAAAMWAEQQAGGATDGASWTRGWQFGGEPAMQLWRAKRGDKSCDLHIGRSRDLIHGWSVHHDAQHITVVIESRTRESAQFRVRGSRGDVNGEVCFAQRHTPEGQEWWFSCAGHAVAYVFGTSQAGAHEVGSQPEVRSPMPGNVTSVLVSTGEIVRAGQPLIVLEAMKMEHQVCAPHDGTVSEVMCAVGSHVRLREVLAVVSPT